MATGTLQAAGGTRLRRLPEIVLVAVTFIWGGTFLVSQGAMAHSGPFGLLAVRFTLGAGALFLLFLPRMRGLTRSELRAGLLVGVVTFASYAFQTTGLLHITSSKSAFITALYVPAVPVLQLVLLAQAPRLSAWLGIAVSFLGLLVLSAGEGMRLSLGIGEWLTLGGAVMAALQIILVSRYAPGAEPIRLAGVQLGVVAALSLLAMPIVGEGMPAFTPAFLAATAALGLLATAFALAAMAWAQQTVSATRATIIYAMEPVWGGVFGAAAGEPMTTATLLGSGLIVGGILVSELRWVPRRMRGYPLRALAGERSGGGRPTSDPAPCGD
jgi:drug/metabolite transporter (DMT)-like permease